jgi:membrane associated rhomboid family serine protease
LSSQSTKKGGLISIVIPVGIVFLMWAIFLLDQEFDLHLSEYGLYPRKVEGLLGIFTIPFIHGSFSHIINNSVPMLVLGWALFRFYPTLAFKTLFWILIISGIWLWISGRSSYHIGASGVVYGLAAFLFLSGWLRREKRVAALSLLVAFLYGSMWWGVLPVDPTISWEGHLWGAVAGFSLAFLYRKQGPQKPVYQWELEDDLPDEGPWNMQEKARNEKRPGQSDSNIEITYTIVSPKKKDDGSKSN